MNIYRYIVDELYTDVIGKNSFAVFKYSKDAPYMSVLLAILVKYIEMCKQFYECFVHKLENIIKVRYCILVICFRSADLNDNVKKCFWRKIVTIQPKAVPL